MVNSTKRKKSKENLNKKIKKMNKLRHYRKIISKAFSKSISVFRSKTKDEIYRNKRVEVYDGLILIEKNRNRNNKLLIFVNIFYI